MEKQTETVKLTLKELLLSDSNRFDLEIPTRLNPISHRADSMKSTKQIEETAFAELRKYVELNWPGCYLEDVRNKGQSSRVAIGDALLTLPAPDGRRFDIELKSSRSPNLPTNLRFTHQTISSALGRDLIVALVWNLDATPKITFFRLGDRQKEIIVEPHFIVQAKHINQNCSLEEILAGVTKPLELSELLSTEVRRHVRKPKAS